MTEKTVAEHLSDSNALAQAIADANALVIKLNGELQLARSTIETLAAWSHPKMTIGPLSGPLFGNKTALTGDVICKLQIARINAVLGDRA